jgi:uncharacterized RDD family membrane protein YckC
MPSETSEKNSPQWREEVALRVRAHRARRRRRTGQDGAMELQFDPPSPAQETILEAYSAEQPPAPEASAAWETRAAEEIQVASELMQPPGDWDPGVQIEVLDDVLHSSGPARESIDLTEAPIGPQVYESLPPFPRIKPRSRERKVIEFPRLNESSIASSDELAEPIGDQLRIFEASDVPQSDQSSLAEIRLSSTEPETEPMDSKFDLPLPVASWERRGLALAVDGIIVASGLALFASTTLYLTPAVTLSKPLLLAAAAFFLVLLTFYEAIFLFYSTATPGMRAAALILTDFSGTAPSRRIRLVRAFAMVLSLAALCLGFIWALIDEDRLGWHDRITHTYLREK